MNTFKLERELVKYVAHTLQGKEAILGTQIHLRILGDGLTEALEDTRGWTYGGTWECWGSTLLQSRR